MMHLGKSSNRGTLIWSLLILLIAVPLVSVVAQSKKFEIVTVVKITGIPWFNRMETGVQKAAKELGVNAYQVGPTDADPAQQVRVVEDLVSKGVDAICVVPDDAKALEPVFARARKQGIIIITHESPDQKGENYDIELIDNVKFAQRTWDMLVKSMGDKGQYAIFVGSLTVPLHNLWVDEGLKYAKAKYPGLQVVTDRIPCGEDQQLSKEKTTELIAAYPNLKGIIGYGSLGPIGAAQAIKEEGLTGKIAIVGTVMPGQAAPYLRDGSLKEGILWDPADAGYAMTWVAKQLLEKKKLTSGMSLPGVGKVSIAGDVITANSPIDITAANADSFNF
jgi:simple sugar transport system substrate-binding protein